MRALVDRHHAGLLHSLQLLLEDRLGIEVYVPVGREWWDRGYWRFGEVFGDDRLCRQYLDEPEGHGWHRDEAGALSDGGWYTHDREFPDRLIRGVTLDRFQETDGWSHIVASVQENQRGFKRLAGERGAKYVLQVGNRGQYVDWDLDPLAIVSAEARIKGRGLNYHQEYDKDGTFAFRPPLAADLRTVRSFVNCFNSMGEQWSRFGEAREAAGDQLRFRVHGHDGADGFTTPIGATAEAMAQSGFAWHDKPQGDGFGHVIHYWASIGRPLVGTAAYYDGLFAQGLWEDGLTCVDLGRHGPRATIDEVLRIVHDPDRHLAMCRRIRERVDELVDFGAEAERIGAFLLG